MDEFPSLNAYVDVISVTGQENINKKEARILKIVNQYETLNDVIKHHWVNHAVIRDEYIILKG